MRVVIAGQTYYPGNNGQAIFTTNLAEGLVQAGHQVMVMVPSDRYRAYRTERQGVRIEALTAVTLVRWQPDVYLALDPYRQSGRLMDRFRPDVVHIQDHYPLSRGVVQAALERRLPLVGSNHFLPENISHYIPMFRAGRPYLNHLLWLPVLDVFNRLDMVTTPTETAAAILRQHGVRTPIQAISCGVDLSRFYPDPGVARGEIRRRYHLDPHRTAFLYVGRIDQEKRLDVLIRAFHRLNRPDLQLAFAGQGRHLAELQNLTRELGLERQIVFAGYVPPDDLPALLNSVDIFAIPSVAELQSIATLEAMATGRPILAARARALPELVEHGANGYLFEPDDVEDAAATLTKLADTPESWPAMGAASLDRVRSHSLHYTIRRYDELYYRLTPETKTLIRSRRAVTVS